MGHARVTASCAAPPQPAAPLILAHLEHAAGCLDFGPAHRRATNALAGGRLREVDQDSFIYIQTVMGHTGSRDRPPLLDRDDGSPLRSASAAPNALLEANRHRL